MIQSDILDILDDKLLSHAESSSLGLASGKTGICVYFYCKSRLTEDKKYKSAAEKLIDEIFAEIDTVGNYNIQSGLAGIGLGIDYLIENKFVSGNINTVLREVDDKLFKISTSLSELEKMGLMDIIQLLCFFYVRLLKLQDNGEHERLIKEVIISLINRLNYTAHEVLFEEPLYFSADYLLPQYMYVLGKVGSLNFYNYKISKILQNISVNLLSHIPLLHSNKLYLLWAMDAVNRQFKFESWNRHIKLLRRELDINVIINDECLSRNIYFNNGLTAIYYLLSALQDFFLTSEISAHKHIIINKIQVSHEWERLLNNGEYFYSKCGLYDGFCGVSLLLIKFEKYENQFN
jgi:hypothetical protein